MDAITLHGMEFYSYHGVLEEEARLGQKFIVDLVIFTNLKKAGRTDDLNATLNYAEAYEVVNDIMTNERYRLLEAVAETIATRILEGFRQAERVHVKVCKVMPPIQGILAGVSVEIERDRVG
ncbi:7,8-dihydroneopterin aldolase [Collibacillus ludicampi]|jgi:dihydroneopterin aldolase|uniref:7,8-dihydroneopterin aldolase n=1 Tax=Collibacillus ludicampi TaxID=2771369 RepID=A0AAV4LEI3_9BACL|nr:dihydroneopterin aldolase [Collibacillus ludicampi]GIM46078.1 7,8-dihydroneopterin aldolase [Collibacillus ludicampi]